MPADLTCLPRRGLVTVARGNIYACPVIIPAGAKAVPIDAFPAKDGAPFRVKASHHTRPILARHAPDPKPGDRVLLFLMNHDLLALYVATVPEGSP